MHRSQHNKERAQTNDTTSSRVSILSYDSAIQLPARRSIERSTREASRRPFPLRPLVTSTGGWPFLPFETQKEDRVLWRQERRRGSLRHCDRLPEERQA